eukprot:3557524-Pleurochrysis_carterae.AAC.1
MCQPAGVHALAAVGERITHDVPRRMHELAPRPHAFARLVMPWRAQWAEQPPGLTVAAAAGSMTSTAREWRGVYDRSSCETGRGAWSGRPSKCAFAGLFAAALRVLVLTHSPLAICCRLVVGRAGSRWRRAQAVSDELAHVAEGARKGLPAHADGGRVSLDSSASSASDLQTYTNRSNGNPSRWALAVQ